ncbi:MULTISPECIES: hypothetical protein [unclassified Nocardioides]|uniref:hypothetical protein n=1 Tax=unclassified Nocardioides TaxID=2615069 RepID=UPI003014288D
MPTTRSRPRRTAAVVVGAGAVVLLALAVVLAARTWWAQRGGLGSYAPIGYTAAVVLAGLGLVSLSLVRSARAAGSAAGSAGLLVLATVPLLLVVAFVLAAAM